MPTSTQQLKGAAVISTVAPAGAKPDIGRTVDALIAAFDEEEFSREYYGKV